MSKFKKGDKVAVSFPIGEEHRIGDGKIGTISECSENFSIALVEFEDGSVVGVKKSNLYKELYKSDTIKESRPVTDFNISVDLEQTVHVDILGFGKELSINEAKNLYEKLGKVLDTVQ